ncbi:MAG: glutathione S-transferase [Paraglaciecola sp.]|jgi:glutathione S-transferase
MAGFRNTTNRESIFGGYQPSAADILLTVYSRWGAHFPVDIPMGTNTNKI